MAEVGQAYLQIIPSMKGVAPAISRQMSGIGESVGAQMGDSIVGKMGTAFGTLAKVGVGAMAAIGTAVGGLAIGGGISRALKIDEATFKFEQMGLDVEAAMASCNEAVTGTAYGLDAAATVAASLGASGVQAGDQMTQALKATAGMAAMSGRSMEEVGLIFGKVAAQGRLQGDELMQFAENGVNATAALASYLGKTQAEVREMVSAGEIDFQTFSDAMYATFGDAAQGANATFSGAMSNVMAALSRVGAKFADPALDGLREVFVALIPAVDAISAALDPLVERFAALVDSGVQAAVPAIEAFTAALESGKGPVEAFKAAFDALPQGMQDAVGAFAAVAGVIGGGAVVGKLAQFGSAVSGAAGNIGKFAMEATTKIPAALGAMSNLPVVGGLFSSLGGKINALGSAVTLAGGGLSGLARVVGGVLMGPVGIAIGVIAALAAAFAYLWNTNEPFKQQMTEIGNQIGASLAPVLQTLGSTLSQLASALLPAVMSIVQALAPVLAMVAQVLGQLMLALAPIVVQLVSMLVPVLQTIIPIIAQIISMVVQVASQVIAAVMPVIMQIVALIQQNMPLIQSIIQTVLGVIQQIFTTVWPVVQAAVEAAMGVIQTVINVVMPIIQGIISAVMSIIQGDWQGAWDAISGALSAAWEAIKQGVSNGINAVVDFFTGLPDKILSAISGIGSWLLDAGGDLVQGLIDGINGAISGVGEAIMSGVGGAVDAFKSFLGIASPSKLFRQFGAYTMEGMALGIEASAGMAERSMLEAAQSVSGAGYAEASARLGMEARANASAAGGDGETLRLLAVLHRDLQAIYDIIPEGMDERTFGRKARKAVTYAI